MRLLLFTLVPCPECSKKHFVLVLLHFLLDFLKLEDNWDRLEISTSLKSGWIRLCPDCRRSPHSALSSAYTIYFASTSMPAWTQVGTSLLPSWASFKKATFGYGPLHKFICVTFWYQPCHEKTCFMPYANNNGADQLVHPRSLISTFNVHFLDSTIPLLAKSKISRL